MNKVQLVEAVAAAGKLTKKEAEVAELEKAQQAAILQNMGLKTYMCRNRL